MSLEFILPEGWSRPRGFTHGVTGQDRRVLCVAGQLAGATGADAPPAGMSLPAQFGASLANVVRVVQAAGGQAGDIAALRVFVTDIQAFKQGQAEIAAAWGKLLGRHFPAMTLVEVRALFEETAQVEIEAQALLPGQG
ncbi:MAG TPA: RidA family protein [Bordetella sp.]